MARAKRAIPERPFAVEIDALDPEGHGIARVDGKVIFVDQGLPGERLLVRRYETGNRFDRAALVKVLRPSSQRVAPLCPHYSRCGGCSLQHLEPSAQVAIKQRTLEEALARIGKVRAERLLSPIQGPSWGYRAKARLSVRTPRSRGVMVGFRERNSSFVADMDSCVILDPRVSRLIPLLRDLIAGLSRPDRLPQIEVATAPEAVDLVLRHLTPFSDGDLAALRDFAEAHGVQLFSQAGGPDTVLPLWPSTPVPLSYTLPDFGLRLRFDPTVFIQVNQAMNQVLTRRAMNLLEPRPGERILDLFCGLGNFTLPMGRLGAEALGVEGEGSLVALATENACTNGLEGRLRFQVADLAQPDRALVASFGRFDKILLDPPRSGAMEILKALEGKARRLVYVSCNPATLARDAELLVHQQGYRLAATGVANMFPHTAHVESIAVFQR